jgi:hypothetical protein
LIIAVSQYIYSLLNWRRARNLRYTFCTLQLIDDLLDGDRSCEMEPLLYVQQLKEAINRSSYDNSDLHVMTKALLARINKVFIDEEEAYRAFLELIDIMMEDRKRVIGEKIFTYKELRHQHHTTFSYSLDITFMAIESSLRTRDLPEILDIFGWCSTVRDLEEDLDKNLINIPYEVASKIPNFMELSTKEKMHHPVVCQWLNAETERAKELFAVCDRKVKPLLRRPGAFMFTMFLSSMKKYTRVRFQ